MAASDRAVAVDLPRVSALAVVLSTIGGVTLSGGVFGLGMVMTSSGLFPSMALLAFVVGCILAFIGAVVVVPLILTSRIFLTASGQDWTAGQIYRFGAICGGLTGFLCIVVPSAFEPAALAIGLIPALVGGIFTSLLLIPLARRVKKRENAAAAERATNSTSEFGL